MLLHPPSGVSAERMVAGVNVGNTFGRRYEHVFFAVRISPDQCAKSPVSRHFSGGEALPVQKKLFRKTKKFFSAALTVCKSFLL